ncbi:MAG: Fic family protein [Akkermansiaceae bacterium]
MRHFASFYSDPGIPATDRLIVVAASHHRLAWIHPFGDGNGRVARLQSQAAMVRCGLDSDGLWTLSRGLARAKPAYFQHLQAADQQRANDFDGRGNLSDAALSRFCRFFLRWMPTSPSSSPTCPWMGSNNPKKEIRDLEI